jgi:hypothetical protein
VAFPLGNVGTTAVERHVLLSYTEGYAIELMERKLRPYWQRKNMPVGEMLETAEHQYAELERRGTEYDAELRRDLVSAGGEDYANLAILAYRQTLAAHKLVADWVSVVAVFPLLQPAPAGGADDAGAELCRVVALAFSVCAA